MSGGEGWRKWKSESWKNVRRKLAGGEWLGGRWAAILGAYVEKVVAATVLVVVAAADAVGVHRGGWRRRALATEDPHLAGVVPRQEVVQGVPAAAHAHHHVSALQQLQSSVNQIIFFFILLNAPKNEYTNNQFQYYAAFLSLLYLLRFLVHSLKDVVKIQQSIN